MDNEKLNERIFKRISVELDNQKKSGKTFVSDEEVDNLIDEILKEEINTKGWVKITNNIVENLVDGEYYFTEETNVGSRIRVLEYSEKSKGFVFMKTKQWITHYQPIIKPNAPTN